MGEQFKPGDLVECVDAQAWGPAPAFGKPTGIIEGVVYTVRALFPRFDGVPLLTLREARNEASWRGEAAIAYRAERFRLIHRPDARLIESLKSLPTDSEDSRDGATPKKERTHA